MHIFGVVIFASELCRSVGFECSVYSDATTRIEYHIEVGCVPLQFLVMLLASNNSLFSVKSEVVIFVVFLGFLQVSLRSLCVHDCLFYQTVPMCPSF
jgi:hypothetical protein